MKKLLVVLVVLAALGWLTWSRFQPMADSRPAVTAALPKPPAPTAKPTPNAVAPAPTKKALVLVPRNEAPRSADGSGYPPLSLEQALQPNNGYRDDVFGVAVTYPEGWSIKQAMRWGKDNRENTVFFQPPEGSAAIPSMYYQKYLDGAPNTADDAEARLREQAAKKEASRQASGATDYQNDPSSFVFREIDGHPTLSYFATFTQNNEVQAEYFTRVLGPQGYVMFFVRGPAKDVQASIAAVSQMAGTVKPP